VKVVNCNDLLFSADSQLNKGSFATVFRALLGREKQPVALKLVNDWGLQTFEEEVETHLYFSTMKAPVPAFYGVTLCIDPEKVFRAGLIMELMGGGSVEEARKNGYCGLHASNKDDEKRLAGIALRAAMAVESIHKLGYAHNDIAMRNFLFDRFRKIPVISDFGLTRKLNKEGICENPPQKVPLRVLPKSAFTHKGTNPKEPYYLSPDTDVWMFGAFLYELYNLDQVFKCWTPVVVAAFVNNGATYSTNTGVVPDGMKPVVAACGKPTGDRPTMTAVIEMIMTYGSKFREEKESPTEKLDYVAVSRVCFGPSVSIPISSPKAIKMPTILGVSIEVNPKPGQGSDEYDSAFDSTVIVPFDLSDKSKLEEAKQKLLAAT